MDQVKKSLEKSSVLPNTSVYQLLKREPLDHPQLQSAILNLLISRQKLIIPNRDGTVNCIINKCNKQGQKKKLSEH